MTSNTSTTQDITVSVEDSKSVPGALRIEVSVQSPSVVYHYMENLPSTPSVGPEVLRELLAKRIAAEWINRIFEVTVEALENHEANKAHQIEEE